MKGNLEISIEPIENGFMVSERSGFPRKNIFFEKEESAKEHAKKIVDGW